MKKVRTHTYLSSPTQFLHTSCDLRAMLPVKLKAHDFSSYVSGLAARVMPLLLQASKGLFACLFVSIKK